MKCYYVYILASIRRILYIGVTGDLEQRLAWHRSFANPDCFTAKYKCTRLVYFEEYTEPTQALDRETQLKKWRRDKKIRLIESLNPEWIDFAEPVPWGKRA